MITDVSTAHIWHGDTLARDSCHDPELFPDPDVIATEVPIPPHMRDGGHAIEACANRSSGNPQKERQNATVPLRK